MLSQNWKCAGLEAAGGGLGRPMAMGTWLRPRRVVLKAYQGGDWIVWSSEQGPPPRKPVYRETRIGPQLLERFLALERGDGRALLSFVKSWGVLDLCGHGLPFVHEGASTPLGCMPMFDVDPWVRWRRGALRWGPLRWEPLSMWQRWARAGRAVLDLASELHRDRRGVAEQWRRIAEISHFTISARVGLAMAMGSPDIADAFDIGSIADASLEVQRQVLAYVVGEWLRLGRVRPGLAWEDDAVRLELSGFGLFGALAIQLAAAVGRSDGWASCPGCGGWFSPPRRATTGKRRYCEECRTDQKPQRDAARDYRARRRQSDQGQPITAS